jgi:Polyketide cyclase / dehydrase and lipid transport
MTEPTESSTDIAAGGSTRIVRRTIQVAAEPQAIFDLLANPASHALLDGSGTVRKSVEDRPDRLRLGSRFSMSMMFGVPYRISNEVVEFDEPTSIAWRHVGGHVWRYRLHRVEPGSGIAAPSAEVTEEFDWSPSRAPWALELLRVPARNARSIEATLDRLVAHFASSG